MEYIGIQSQIRKNNFFSIVMLLAFPLLLMAMFYAIIFFIPNNTVELTNSNFFSILPYILIGTSIWFSIAWLFHSSMIQVATGSRPLLRTENMRIYNILENLCIASGFTMPKLYIINDDSLNAFASGISQKTYSITLSKGIIEKLTDEELECVIAHELAHIRNRDVRLLIISIIFVGIFAFISEMAFRSLRFSGRSKNGQGAGLIILVAIAVSAISYLISQLLSFGISRSREFLADAGASEMTKNPNALASALRKISSDPAIEAVESRDVAQLFIENPKPSVHGFSWDNLFSTHPPIQKRIEILEQFT